jgi:hypothetical protein
VSYSYHGFNYINSYNGPTQTGGLSKLSAIFGASAPLDPPACTPVQLSKSVVSYGTVLLSICIQSMLIHSNQSLRNKLGYTTMSVYLRHFVYCVNLPHWIFVKKFCFEGLCLSYQISSKSFKYVVRTDGHTLPPLDAISVKAVSSLEGQSLVVVSARKLMSSLSFTLAPTTAICAHKSCNCFYWSEYTRLHTKIITCVECPSKKTGTFWRQVSKGRENRDLFKKPKIHSGAMQCVDICL